MAAAARGDAAAFEELFLRHRAGVHAYALRMLRDHGRAEDVVQEVFVAAMRAIREGRQPEHVRAWLQEVARRACIDQWRGVTRRGEVSLDAPERLLAGDADRLADDDSVLRAAEDHASLRTLRSALDDLPPLQRAVLVQRELEGRSTDEISRRLEITVDAVEGQLTRARRGLQAAYRELDSGERCVSVRRICDASLRGAIPGRDRRLVVAHVRGCETCRRHARAVGVDPRMIEPTPLAAKLAFLLPLPLLRRGPVDALLGQDPTAHLAATKVVVGAAVLAAGGGGVLATGGVPPGPWPGVERPAATVAAAPADAHAPAATGDAAAPVLVRGADGRLVAAPVRAAAPDRSAGRPAALERAAVTASGAAAVARAAAATAAAPAPGAGVAAGVGALPAPAAAAPLPVPAPAAPARPALGAGPHAPLPASTPPGPGPTLAPAPKPAPAAPAAPAPTDPAPAADPVPADPPAPADPAPSEPASGDDPAAPADPAPVPVDEGVTGAD